MHEWLTGGSLTLKLCWINYKSFGLESSTVSPCHTHPHEAQAHKCRCETNPSHVKALGNQEEAPFCFHKQLPCFRLTACPEGLDGWRVRAPTPPRACMFSGFPSSFADVAHSNCVAWTPARRGLNAFLATFREPLTQLRSRQTGVGAAKCVWRGTSDRFCLWFALKGAPGLKYDKAKKNYGRVVSHAATKDSNPTCRGYKCIHSHVRRRMFKWIKLWHDWMNYRKLLVCRESGALDRWCSLLLFLSISHYIRWQIITVALLFITASAMQSVDFLCQSNLTSSIFYSPAFSVCSENVGEYLPLQNLLQTATVRFSHNGTLFTRWCFGGEETLTMDGWECSHEGKKRETFVSVWQGREGAGEKRWSIVVWVSCSRDLECCIELHN